MVMRKKIVGMFLIFIMSSFMLSLVCEQAEAGIQANADDSISAVLATDRNKCYLSIDGSTATYKAIASQQNADSITITLTLQKKSDGTWVNVKSTTDTFTCSTAILSATKVVSSGTYRAKAVITIKSGTSKTTLTKYSTTETK